MTCYMRCGIFHLPCHDGTQKVLDSGAFLIRGAQCKLIRDASQCTDYFTVKYCTVLGDGRLSFAGDLQEEAQ